MKRLSLRLTVCVTALALTCAPLMTVRAESRKPLFSRLNPKSWFKKSDEPDGKMKTVDEPTKGPAGAATSSVRSHLKNEDPFVIPPTNSANSPATVDKSRTPAVDRSAPQLAPSIADRPGTAKVTSNDFEEFGRDRKPTSSKTSEAQPKNRSTAASSGGNQFEDGFDEDFAAIVNKAKADAPKLPDPAAKARDVAQSAPRLDRSLLPDLPEREPATETRSRSERVSEFERFVSEREGKVQSEAAEFESFGRSSATAEEPAAAEPTPPARTVAKAKRLLLDPEDESPQEVEKHVSREPSEVIAESRRELKSSSLLRNQLAAETGDERTEKPAPTKLSQLTVSADRSRDKVVAPAPNLARSRSNAATESRPVVVAREELPLIVPNDQVPDRRLYVANQTFRTASAETVVTVPSKEPLPSVGSIEVPTSNLAARSNPAPVEIAPRAAANKAPSQVMADNNRVRQLSHEDQNPVELRYPVLSIGASPVAESEASSNSPLLFPPAGIHGEAGDGAKRSDLSARESAPPIDWPDADEVQPVAGKKSGALIAVLGIVGAALGLGVVLRKKAAIATTSGTAVGDSPEMGS